MELGRNSWKIKHWPLAYIVFQNPIWHKAKLFWYWHKAKIFWYWYFDIPISSGFHKRLGQSLFIACENNNCGPCSKYLLGPSYLSWRALSFKDHFKGMGQYLYHFRKPSSFFLPFTISITYINYIGLYNLVDFWNRHCSKRSWSMVWFEST